MSVKLETWYALRLLVSVIVKTAALVSFQVLSKCKYLHMFNNKRRHAGSA